MKAKKTKELLMKIPSLMYNNKCIGVEELLNVKGNILSCYCFSLFCISICIYDPIKFFQTKIYNKIFHNGYIPHV